MIATIEVRRKIAAVITEVIVVENVSETVGTT